MPRIDIENANILIVDVGAVSHNIKHGFKNKKKLGTKEHATYILHGFLNRLIQFAVVTQPDFVIFALDSESSKRKEIYTNYKNREKKDLTPEEKDFNKVALKQFIELETYILPKLGFRNIIRFEGLEADDIIARVCKTYGTKNYITIATNDHDIFQCLTSSVRIYNVRTNGFYTKKDFKKEFGIKPKEWVAVKILAGCSSDKVPNVVGVKEKTAIKCLKGEMNPNSKTYQNIINFPNKKRNKQLVKLPFKGTPKIKIRKDHLELSDLKEVCKKYKFKYLWSRRKEWRKYLNFR